VSAPAAVAAHGLAVGYPGAPPALREVDFAAPAGRIVGVLGPNGGGKTTLFRALTGELTPRAGTLERPEQLAVVAQTDRSRLDFPVSALDVALLGALPGLPWWRRPGRAHREAAREALDRVGLAGEADRTFGELSGGQRQRVLVARALVQDAPVLLLDEPFRGVDRASAERLEALLVALAGEGRTLLVATHDVAQARRWPLVLCLNREQIAFGDPAATLTEDVLLRTQGGHLVGHHGC
jgi:ABC-type Mn2+/Zn2+ transport system ATPase subunit